MWHIFDEFDNGEFDEHAVMSESADIE
jgi:hypothetical protein